MGREVCKAIVAEADLDLVCAVDPAWVGQRLDILVPGLETDLSVVGEIESLVESQAEVMVDFSIAPAARGNVPYALEHKIHCVVGTTGFAAGELADFDRIAANSGVGCLVAPNFAIGAVLMMDFARRAGRYMQDCEIVELHHSAKIDAPSGTARETARLIGEARSSTSPQEKEEGSRGLDLGGIRIHSVRLPGLVAHQEVIFGGPGQTLTIRHDSFDRSSFMPGVIMAVRKIADLRGLILGLGSLLQ